MATTTPEKFVTDHVVSLATASGVLDIFEGGAVFLQTGRSLRRARAAVANGAQPQEFLQVDETPLEKVPPVQSFAVYMLLR